MIFSVFARYDTASARLSDILAVWMKSKNRTDIYTRERGSNAGATCIVS